MRFRNFQRSFSGMNRRDFLLGSAAAAAASSMSLPARGQDVAPGHDVASGQDAATPAKGIDRIAVMTSMWSGRGQMAEVWGDWSKPPAPGKIDMLDLPQLIADQLHLHHLDVSNFNLISMDPSYIGEFKERMRKANTKAVDVIVELDPPETKYRGYVSVCSPNAEVRAHAIEETKKWIDIAAMLEAPSIMPNQGVPYLPGAVPRPPRPPAGSAAARRPYQPPPWNRENLQALVPCIEGLKTVVDYGKTKGVAVILEPRGESLDELVYMIMGSGAYSNPQIGTVEGLRLLYPLARTIQHVNLRGNLPVAIPLSKQLDFNGWFSIEAGGPPDPPVGGIQAVIDELLKLGV